MIVTTCCRCYFPSLGGDICSTCLNAVAAERSVSDVRVVSLARFLEPKAPTFTSKPLTPAERRRRFRLIVGGLSK